ncbi:uncharacterized protein LOC128549656 isoform X2 [Mercenaria mercenaria]|uniref:uncharacterized protein LOC128549656 isoform X2 n=1 Tax=Mercenaria mercenaria TaxID=6596 RepID=UPI00234EAA2E|nr:uncharacterized protein LOC128549656 isoform X2 [Mercenaria mercenaria]
MATTENEYYLRTILLLAEGGSYISKQILYKELPGDLNKLLKHFEHKLKHELHDKQIEKLFPRNGNTFVDTWDLQMLIIVVLRLFHKSLKYEDKRNLQYIKMLRNEVQAHSSSVTLDDVQYENIKDHLTDALTSLASGFGENVQQECRSFINKYTSGPLDVMSARECLKQLQNNDVLFKQVLEKIESSNNDICTHLNASQKSLSDDVKNVSQQMKDLENTLIEKLQRLDAGIYRKKVKVGMHVELSLGGPTEEWILLMERTLNDVFNEAYKTSGGKFEDIKKIVDELLEDIKQNTTINFKGSKMMCIILMFECFTYSGLLDLLQYLTSQKYQRRLSALTETLSTHFKVDIPVTATSTISPECLQHAYDDLEHEREQQETENCHSHPSDESKKSLKLSMECSSVEDLVYLWEMFQQGGASHYLDRIADKLSAYSGKKITLSSSLNLEEFKEALEDTLGSAVDAEGGRSKITVESLKGADVRKRQITGKQVTFGSAADAKGGRSKTIEMRGEKDALHKPRKMYFCFYGNHFPLSEGYISSGEVIGNLNLLEAGERAIEKVYVYKYPLTPLSFLDFLLYHILIVLKTETRFWSIERSVNGITIQTSTDIGDLLRLYRATKRSFGETLETDARGYRSVSELITWLKFTGELDKNFNPLTRNCTTFANAVFEYVSGGLLLPQNLRPFVSSFAARSTE